MLRLYQTLILQTNLAVRSGGARRQATQARQPPWPRPRTPSPRTRPCDYVTHGGGSERPGHAGPASNPTEETTYAYEAWNIKKFRPK